MQENLCYLGKASNNLKSYKPNNMIKSQIPEVFVSKLILVELQKADGESWGFAITLMGYIIYEISPGGVAEKQGGLRLGDQLISINGVNVEDTMSHDIITFLLTTANDVKLIVRKTKLDGDFGGIRYFHF